MNTYIESRDSNYKSVVLKDVNIESGGFWFYELDEKKAMSQIDLITLQKESIAIEVLVSLDAMDWKTIYSGDILRTCTIDISTTTGPSKFIYVRALIQNITFPVILLTYNTKLIPFHKSILIDDKRLSNTVRNALVAEAYEWREISLALSYLDRDDIVLELGSSIGGLSAALLKFKTVKQYYCVEANPEIVHLLEANHKINGLSDVTILNGVLCLNPTATEVDFYISSDSSDSSLHKEDMNLAVQKVPTYCFNSTIAKILPNFLICDIEHGEFDIFRENCNISSVNKICIEIHASPKQSDLYAFFKSNGLRPTIAHDPALQKQHVNMFVRD